MVANTIDAIMQGIADLENGIAQPDGAPKAAVLATPEPPTTFDSGPLFLNLEREADVDQYRAFGAGNGPVVWSVDAYLLFALADQKYSMRTMRAWVEPVYDAFERDRTGLGGSCAAVYARRPRVGGALVNGQQYLAVTTRLTVLANRT